MGYDVTSCEEVWMAEDFATIHMISLSTASLPVLLPLVLLYVCVVALQECRRA